MREKCPKMGLLFSSVFCAHTQKSHTIWFLSLSFLFHSHTFFLYPVFLVRLDTSRFLFYGVSGFFILRAMC